MINSINLFLKMLQIYRSVFNLLDLSFELGYGNLFMVDSLETVGRSANTTTCVL